MPTSYLAPITMVEQWTFQNMQDSLDETMDPWYWYEL